MASFLLSVEEAKLVSPSFSMPSRAIPLFAWNRLNFWINLNGIYRRIFILLLPSLLLMLCIITFIILSLFRPEVNFYQNCCINYFCPTKRRRKAWLLWDHINAEFCNIFIHKWILKLWCNSAKLVNVKEILFATARLNNTFFLRKRENNYGNDYFILVLKYFILLTYLLLNFSIDN